MSVAPFTDDEIRTLRGLVAFIRGGGSPGAKASGAATDAELDGRFGNRTVKKDPKRWAGASYAGASYSRCSSEYLLCLAEFLEWKADQDSKKPDPKCHQNGTPWYEYDRKDARLARGWARRNEGKEMPPPDGGIPTDEGDGGYVPPDDALPSGDEDIPF